jgi:hypothetical protein
MRARFAIVGSLVMMLVLALLMSPASGQTAILPETTPEFWPLTFDPATVTVDPEGFTLVFEAPMQCRLAPDEKSVVVYGVGVFDLASGEKRFDLKGRVAGFSYDNPHLLVRNDGLYDLNTGERLIKTDSSDAWLYALGRFLLDGSTVYDTNNGQVFVQYPTTEPVREAFPLPWNRNWVIIAREITDGNSTRYAHELLDAATGLPVTEPFAFMNGIFEGPADVSRDGTLIAIGGSGVFDLDTGEKHYDLPQVYSMQFTEQGSALFILTIDQEIQVIDGPTGEVLFRRENIIFEEDGRLLFDRWGGFVLSPNGKTLLAPEYTTVRANGGLSYLPLETVVIDVESGETRARLPGGSVGFLRDGNHIFVGGHGIFDAATGQSIRSTPELSDPPQVMQGTYYGIIQTGETSIVTDPQTWETKYEFSGGYRWMSKDSRWLLTSQGVYDLETGEQILPIEVGNVSTSLSGDYLTAYSRNSCAIYRTPVLRE